MRGSVVPAMILPLTFILLWATCITCISKFKYPGSKYFLQQYRYHILALALRSCLRRCDVLLLAVPMRTSHKPTIPCLALDPAHYHAPP
jgi:hypothetical protein